MPLPPSNNCLIFHTPNLHQVVLSSSQYILVIRASNNDRGHGQNAKLKIILSFVTSFVLNQKWHCSFTLPHTSRHNKAEHQNSLCIRRPEFLCSSQRPEGTLPYNNGHKAKNAGASAYPCYGAPCDIHTSPQFTSQLRSQHKDHSFLNHLRLPYSRLKATRFTFQETHVQQNQEGGSVQPQLPRIPTISSSYCHKGPIGGKCKPIDCPLTNMPPGNRVALNKAKLRSATLSRIVLVRDAVIPYLA